MFGRGVAYGPGRHKGTRKGYHGWRAPGSPRAKDTPPLAGSRKDRPPL